MIKINSPYQFFYDLAGNNLENGSIYIGAANTDPRNNPITVYWDAAGTIPAQQPLRTIGGVITRAGTPSNIYAASDYSLSVYDSNNVFLYNVPSYLASVTEDPVIGYGGTITVSGGTLTIPNYKLGDTFYVNGGTLINSLTSSYTGRVINLYFLNNILLVNSSYLLLQNGANILASAGDFVTFIQDDAANNIWRCVNYTSGEVPSGRNRLINGNFDIWQSGTSFAIPQNSYTYCADQFRISYNTGSVAVTQNTHSVANAAYGKYYMSVALTGANTTPIEQPMESVRTLAGQSVTFSFYANIASGSGQTVGIAATQYFGTGGSPSASVRTAASIIVANTGFARYSVTLALPSLSGKTIGTNGDDYLLIAVELPGGTYTFDTFGWQFEARGVATPFEFRPLAQELMLCQRFFEKSYRQNVVPGTVTNIGGVAFPIVTAVPNGYQVGPSVNYVVTKRATPTITIYSYNGVNNKFTYSGGTDAGVNSCQPNLISDYCFFCINNSGASTSLTTAAQFHFTANARF